MITVYGIKNCDTMKKTFKWLDEHNVAYDFYDYKKHGTHREILDKAIQQHGWENVINRRGMTWRQLPDNIKESMTKDEAVDIAIEKPSIIKRPLIANGNDILLGFDTETYKDKLK